MRQTDHASQPAPIVCKTRHHHNMCQSKTMSLLETGKVGAHYHATKCTNATSALIDANCPCQVLLIRATVTAHPDLYQFIANCPCHGFVNRTHCYCTFRLVSIYCKLPLSWFCYDPLLLHIQTCINLLQTALVIVLLIGPTVTAHSDLYQFIANCPCHGFVTTHCYCTSRLVSIYCKLPLS